MPNTRFPMNVPKVDVSGVTIRVKEIAQRLWNRPILELVEVTGVSGTSITIRKIGTTVDIPGVKCVGWGAPPLPSVGDTVWVLWLEGGALPIAIGTVSEAPHSSDYIERTSASGVSPSTTTDFAIAGITVPFDGDMYLTGFAPVAMFSAGDQEVGLSLIATPLPDTFPTSTYRTEAGPSTGKAVVPMLCAWYQVTKGDVLSVALRVANGAGTPTVVAGPWYGRWECVRHA